MKSTKRLVAIVLMAIMMLGATFTAMAANGSMKELTDALNAPRYAGLNEWITKYEADWEKIDVSSWLPTPEKMAETMNAILIDETKLDKHALNLRFHLGVEGFNAFIKEYNEGTVQ